jgi:hypothetical protein
MLGRCAVFNLNFRFYAFGFGNILVFGCFGSHCFLSVARDFKDEFAAD